MNQHQILLDYLRICNQFRNGTFGKSERKLRHQLLVEWTEKNYDIVNVDELNEFFDKHNELCYNKLFVQKVVVPTVSQDFANENIYGIRYLFRCFKGHDNLYNSAESPLNIFCEAINESPIQLADFLLSKEPRNSYALEYKYHTFKKYLEFSLHEIPVGILDGGNGANVSDIPHMLHTLSEFQQLSKRLRRENDITLIEQCRILYPAYKKYLQSTRKYSNFESYLNKHNIAYHND